MYCSSCGGSIQQQLTYCNHCGSRLNLAKREEELAQINELNPESTMWAIVSIFIGGMGVIIGLLAVMKNVLHFDIGLLIFFSMLTFLMLIVIESVFIWKFLGRKGFAKHVEPRELPANTTAELGGVQPKTLAEPLHSVTDQTTRSFEPVLTKRTSE